MNESSSLLARVFAGVVFAAMLVVGVAQGCDREVAPKPLEPAAAVPEGVVVSSSSDAGDGDAAQPSSPADVGGTVDTGAPAAARPRSNPFEKVLGDEPRTMMPASKSGFGPPSRAFGVGVGNQRTIQQQKKGWDEIGASRDAGNE